MDTEKKLVEIAIEAQKNSYSPYINAAIKFIKQNYNIVFYLQIVVKLYFLIKNL